MSDIRLQNTLNSHPLITEYNADRHSQGVLCLIYVYKAHSKLVLLTIYCISALSVRSPSALLFAPQMSLLTFHHRDLELLLRSKWFSPNCHDTITGIDGVSVMHLTVKLFVIGHLYRDRQSVPRCSPNRICRKKLMFASADEIASSDVLHLWLCNDFVPWRLLTHKTPQRRKIIHGKDWIDLKMCISRISSRCSCC